MGFKNKKNKNMPTGFNTKVIHVTPSDCGGITYTLTVDQHKLYKLFDRGQLREAFLCHCEEANKELWELQEIAIRLGEEVVELRRENKKLKTPPVSKYGVGIISNYSPSTYTARMVEEDRARQAMIEMNERDRKRG